MQNVTREVIHDDSSMQKETREGSYQFISR
jgi:hypothetical protein